MGTVKAGTLPEYRQIIGLPTAEQLLQIRNGLCGGLLRHRAGSIKHTEWTGADSYRAQLIFDSTVQALGQADIVLWHRELWELAYQGKGLFDDRQVVPADIPSYPQLWFWETTTDAEDAWDLPEGGDYVSEGVLVSPTISDRVGRAGVMTTFIFVPRTRPKDGWMAPILRCLPSSYVGEPWLTGSTGSGLDFLKQKLVTSRNLDLHRSARRRLERADVPISPVRTVQLRRKEGQAYTAKGEAVEWSCQWIVRSHWRQQYLPSKGEHRPTLVDAYVKGPEDKPLRPPRETVFRVVR